LVDGSHWDIPGTLAKKAERNRKEKEKAFERLISLPREQHETRLAELAKRFDEDVAAIRDDFTVFVGMESGAASADPWKVEPWPDPIESRVLLQEISAKISKYIVMRPEAVTATVLWTTMAWAHEGAAHSPILAAISVEPDSGNSAAGALVRSVLSENSRYPGQDQIAPHDSKSKYYSQDVAQNAQRKS
jgi:hypothetical protein